MNSTALLLIPLLPLAGFVLLGLFGRRYFSKWAGVLGTILLLVSAALALQVAYDYFFISGNTAGEYIMQVPFQVTWLPFANGMNIDMGVLLDPISAMMIVVVTFVSLMVHLYSLGYMKGEERFATYYAFLGLFTFSMLGLVMSSNLFQIYIFWELVGVSSFLLIGYYFDKPSAVAASKKAFIVTRFADLGFLIGILILSFHAGTLDFHTLIIRLIDPGSSYLASAVAASFLGVSALTWGLVLVFIGGAGKSAMFPLHIWLPDAMEGPTPVSALIHAATMVVAGVFLVARLFPVYAFSCPAALNVVTVIGASSALIAAIIACTQTDIKRVLAYSTMSQIGYMMFALGISRMEGENGLGFMASQFHLFTHAFFKALLFLAAGAVIHAVHSNEMGDMGGLRKRLPVTHITFLLACLAIAGIPPFSGFFSKEEILAAAWQSNKAVYAIGLLTAALTAFYMFRLYYSVFWSKEPSHSDGHGEGPLTMKIPMLVLAVGAVAAGWLPFSHYVTADGEPLETEFNLMQALPPVLLALAAIFLARSLYKVQNDKPQKMAAAFGNMYRAAYRKFYIDEAWLFITQRVVFNLVGRPAAWIDKHIVDGLMNGIAWITARLSVLIRGFQSGKVQDYAIWFFAGVVCFAVLFVYLFK